MADNTGNPINANNQGNANTAQNAANTQQSGTMSQADLQNQSAANTGNQTPNQGTAATSQDAQVPQQPNAQVVETGNVQVQNAQTTQAPNAPQYQQQAEAQMVSDNQIQNQQIPQDLGNDLYQLPDGSQVQGREQAYAQYEQWKQSNQVTIQQGQQANVNPNAQANVQNNTSPNTQDNAQSNTNPNTQDNANYSVNPNTNSNQVPYEPKHVGGGWYQLSTGEKIQGEQKAKEAQEEISRDEARKQAGEQRAQTQIQQPVRIQVTDGEAIQAFGPSSATNGATILRFTKHDDHSQKIDIQAGQILYVGQDLTPEEAEQLLELTNWKFERVNVNNG